MYKLLRTATLPNTANKPWLDGEPWLLKDISKVKLVNVVKLYRNLILEVETPYGIKYCDLYNQVTKVILKSTPNKTVEEWLVDMDTLNSPIFNPDITRLPFDKKAHVLYEDARFAGYNVNLASTLSSSLNTAPPTGVKNLYPNIELKRELPVTDMSEVNKYCLITVNGLVHYDFYDNNAVIVQDAGNTVSVPGNEQSQVGLLSFKNVGPLIKKKINFREIFSELRSDALPPVLTGNSLQLHEKVHIKIEHKEGYIPMLILGGYIVYYSPGILTKTSATALTLFPRNLPIAERVLESMELIHLNRLGINRKDVLDKGLSMDVITSDLFIKEYLTMTQSFIVYVKTNSLLMRSLPVIGSKLPGMVKVHTEPSLPLMANYGRLIEYWHVEESDCWSVTTGKAGLFKDYVHNTIGLGQTKAVSEATVTNTTLKERMNWLDIYAYSEK